MTTESGKTPPATADAAWWTQTTVSTPATELAPTTKTPKPKHAKLTLEGAFEVLRCPVCSRANPQGAYYCHFDGKPLFEELRPTPLQVGSLPFPSPFCFSNGQACTNFNQLALACNNLWEEARELLTDGIWSTFFAAMGRLDLAAAAKQAAKEPDPDRGLSQLLEKLPVDPEFLRPPKLAVATSEVDLGQLTPGTDYTFDLTIQNQGMLLLHGIVLSNFEWLVLGDHVKPCPVTAAPLSVRPCAHTSVPGDRAKPTEKLFQTRHGCTIPVLVLGRKLRAGLKPLLGGIIVDTNAGAVTVPVRATLPIRPFPKGVYANDVLAGVRTPRELAARAKQFPNEAGVLFEQGAVKAWYASNGWTYPIEGADGVGAGAVQQFFEALGLTKPPVLEIDTTALSVEGKAGETLLTHITLRTKDGKPVYAHASSSQEWIKLGPLKYLGTKVQIPVRIAVSADLGKTAQAEVTIQGNAKQTFVVPVTLTVKRR
ncbi:MAG: hypothetical protein K2R98_06080 [Gemmataceae bacterium]|nr:hypothetical protein [Gemmataceae bacterium]